MRKRTISLALLLAFSGAMCMGMTNVYTVNASESEFIEEETLNLIQDGAIITPSCDYSFEEDNIITFADPSESSDTEQQINAQTARESKGLDERKMECAQALYSAMINYVDTINVSQFALTKAEFKETISDLVNSNPELFYIGQNYGVTSFYLTGNSGDQIVNKCMGFYECQNPIKETRVVNGVNKQVTVGYTEVDTELINEQKTLLDNKKEAIINEIITDGMSDSCKALLIHDYLILNIKYDYATYLENQSKGTSIYPESDYDIYGALISGQAVCQGYSLAYKYLMEAAGVSDVGFANNAGHIWNTVTIDEEGYYVDCTWDDPAWDTLGNVKHKYLLKGSSDFTGHGTILRSDIECNGTAYSDYFWNDINSGIFYHNGKFYYIGTDGKLCERDGLDKLSNVKVTELSLKKTDDWNYINAAKLALTDKYAVYHDDKKLYAYSLNDGKTGELYTPDTSDDELIYGIARKDNVLSYGTRNTSEIVSEQNIYSYSLPDDPFNIPIESVSVSGRDTLYITMADGKYNYEKSQLNVVIMPENATNQKIKSWSSSNTKVLTVDINGVIKAVSPGEVTVTVKTKEGPSATKTVKVAYDGDITDNDGTVLHYSDGALITNQFYKENGKEYYLGSDGKPVKGFKNIDGKTYYFNADGVMQTGWQTISGSKYYFNSNGVMQKNCFLDDGGNRYFLNSEGKMMTGLLSINDKMHYFDSNGVMLTGWQTIDNALYYFNVNGIMQKGTFVSDGGHKYYVNSDGKMVIGFNTISGNVYYFDTNGVMLTGFQTINGTKYCFDSNGVMLTGWQTISGKKYYMDSNGVMLTGWQTIDGSKNYFDENGVCLTVGWQTIDGSKYYFNMKGVPVTGWQKIEKKTYYFNNKGIMLTGWQKINKKKYYFNKDGVMQTGFKKIKKKTYYFSKKGVMQTGFKVIKKKTYYFNNKGIMLTGWKTIGGQKYYFNKKGVMAKGLTVIKGVSYYFAPDGHFIS